MKFDPRKHIFIDSKVQGVLVLRVVVYWVLTIVTACLLVVWWNYVQGASPQLTGAMLFGVDKQQLESILVVSAIILPILLIDSVLLSNRFVGPVLRLRHSLRALAKGETVPPLDFRTRDLWQEMAQDFNAVAVYVSLLKKQLELATPESERTEDAEYDPLALMR